MEDRSRTDSLLALLEPRYEIRAELGRGGMSVVYLADDRKHRRKVAIKVLRPDLAHALGPERFLREIRIVAGLNHPNIVGVHDSGGSADTLFYIMPYIEGESLRARLERDGPLPMPEVIALARHVADALDHAHRQDIVHRDLKPENILLAQRHALVADFGVARAITEAGGDGLTEPGLAVGTPHYMSPEQASADPRIDGRSDVYSLGVVVYEALTGEPPFRSATPRAALARKLNDEVPPIRTVRESVPAPVEAAVLRALARLPGDRFPSAGEFVDALEVGYAAGNRRGPWRFAGRRKATVTVAALVAALLMAVWLLRRDIAAAGRDERPAIRSIAVLPLQDRSGGEARDYLVDGLTDGITIELGRLSALAVRSRTSAARFRDPDRPAPEIAQALRADALVEGSAAFPADSVLVTLALVDGASDRQLWTGSFQGHFSQLDMVQREIVRALADALRLPLTVDEQVRLASAVPVDPAAQRELMMGNFHLGNARFVQGLEAYRRATEIDTTLAPAYAGMALAYSQLGSWWGSVPPDSAFPLAMRAAQHAIALDPSNAEAHIALANVLRLYERDWDGARSEFRRGMELNPSSTYARVEYANFLTSMRDFGESIELGRETLHLEPTVPTAYNELGFAMDLAGDNAAIELYRASLDIDPMHEQTLGLLAFYFVRREVADSALAHLAAWEVHLATSSPSNIALSAAMYAAIGETSRARELIDMLHRRNAEDSVPPSSWAMVRACLGETELALRYLEFAVGQRDPSLVWINDRGDPCFRRLHGNPRFETVLRSMRFPR